MIKITKDKAKSLHSISKEVTLPLSKEDKDLLEEMIVYLRNTQKEDFREEHPGVREGIGLAAPQVGVNKRMLVISYPIDEEGTLVEHMLVNPKIISNSLRQCYLEGGEGCLSVDEPHLGRVYRSYKITVKALEASTNEEVTIKAVGYDAIVLQHEIDHLDGILFYDHIDKQNPNREVLGAVAI
jgi:peptide deformylase